MFSVMPESDDIPESFSQVMYCQKANVIENSFGLDNADSLHVNNVENRCLESSLRKERKMESVSADTKFATKTTSE